LEMKGKVEVLIAIKDSPNWEIFLRKVIVSTGERSRETLSNIKINSREF